ncbi:hypothetical protein DSW25_14860 [Sulfitobacter donghicola DSW-25 = KCTC 12864 = JCM 14565]|uniref:Uncharacterized protein n=1 Tax=Sulfitobacter donghicola DSW-25 = KCTC 12864 = JCM 14565 TaxID=1300350 RepID=A0A073IGC1_9RHOB|nr:hypothetical protein DSW25_14860 [Sulfitobacter donghicola DSW-25 = KCTC 12864 = JCM 14565]
MWDPMVRFGEGNPEHVMDRQNVTWMVHQFGTEAPLKQTPA